MVLQASTWPRLPVQADQLVEPLLPQLVVRLRAVVVVGVDPHQLLPVVQVAARYNLRPVEVVAGASTLPTQVPPGTAEPGVPQAEIPQVQVVVAAVAPLVAQQAQQAPQVIQPKQVAVVVAVALTMLEPEEQVVPVAFLAVVVEAVEAAPTQVVRAAQEPLVVW